MTFAIDEAMKALSIDEVPIGAVVLSADDKILATGFNKKESTFDPLSHAECLALTHAGKFQKDWRLTGCKIYVTLEPCIMCLAAMVHARIDTLVFGAYDQKAGALSLGYNFSQDKRLNHQFKIIGGVMHFENSRILSNFFKERRAIHKQKQWPK